ncbi:MAG: hypothetical protein IPP94_18605 [Ignavibacteria bacterium]|nr:hypothetical protein [Ignavibacteria bacterium]
MGYVAHQNSSSRSTEHRIDVLVIRRPGSRNFFLSYGMHFEGRILSNRGAIIPFAYLRLGSLTMRPSLTHAAETTEADEVTAFTYGIGAASSSS